MDCNRSVIDMPLLQARAIAVEVVIPMMDKIRTILDVHFVTATGAARGNFHCPAQIMIVTTMHPEQNFILLAGSGVGRDRH
jgi:hypothetical protein